MLGDPFLFLDGKPQGINAQSDNAQKDPFNPLSEEASCLAFEYKTTSIDDLVLIEPSVLPANRARDTESEREYDKEEVGDIESDKTTESCGEFAFSHCRNGYVDVCLSNCVCRRLCFCVCDGDKSGCDVLLHRALNFFFRDGIFADNQSLATLCKDSD